MSTKPALAPQYLPIYDTYFPKRGEQAVSRDWQGFRSQAEDVAIPLSQRQVDFTILDPAYRTWKDVAKNVVAAIGGVLDIFHPNKERNTLLLRWVIKAILLPYTALQFLVQRLVMLILFPAQSRLMKWFVCPELRTAALNEKRKIELRNWTEGALIVREVTLEKKGIKYSGFVMGSEQTIDNGRWALQAFGNAEAMEQSAPGYAIGYGSSLNFNILFINGPSVGKSEGRATPETIGDAQEVGISFLETALKATKIVIAGRSLGGAAIGQAILQHTFKPGTQYLVVRQMTFDRVSHIAEKMIGCGALGRFAAKLVRWSGCEMDSVAASRKLQQLGIKEVIVQAGSINKSSNGTPCYRFESDGIIPAEASLFYALVRERVQKDKIFVGLGSVGHNAVSARTLVRVAEECILAEFRKN